ncbi:c-type cytochrome [Mesoterricola silvestris]|uniref:Cytochrome c domain-containing protein n=1 Tax=Mesoterricola silvestris TaxID=2927979 RepID=A0AA48K8B0_9BACT|nr:cytochrome c [Mesoterricola silvestris]BDU71945.1 hypothetical protein METEAL_11190 [Mesoterricola silvestris]
MTSLLGLALCAAVVQTAPPDRPLPVLRHLYAENCARCHGLDGSARSPEGTRLKGLDFTSARDMEGRTDQEMAQAIASGLFFGLRMPAFRSTFSETEIRTLIREVLRKARRGRPLDEPAER